ncbi:Guanine nucleotide exchange factor for Cdc42p [Coemansia erecta]|nr:Guanine nucleotide exchange factor for Cdc42p [Coemansia sp. RSA 2618]KAJ2824186.1 Guanine nucleotide exchange factor for Cdc42p [Coemansia erecta]
MAHTKERAAEQSQVSPTVIGSQRSGSGQQEGYESEEDMPRRARYSEGSSLTASMQQEKAPGALAYRKTYDGAARARGNAKKLAGDYQSELVDGIERSATISTFHRRQGTGGSSSSFGDAGEQHRNRSSPMPGGPYYPQQDMPPVPPVYRTDDGRPIPHKAPGIISIGSPLPATAFTSAISPMTPGNIGVPSAAPSPMSLSTTPVQSGAPSRAIKVKVHFQNDIFVIILRNNVTFDDLVSRVDRKIKICAGPHVGINSSNEHDIASAPVLNIRMRYEDEDGDMILIGSDEDVQLAFESASAAKKDETAMSTLNLFVSI